MVQGGAVGQLTFLNSQGLFRFVPTRTTFFLFLFGTVDHLLLPSCLDFASFLVDWPASGPGLSLL